MFITEAASSKDTHQYIFSMQNSNFNTQLTFQYKARLLQVAKKLVAHMIATLQQGALHTRASIYAEHCDLKKIIIPTVNK